MMMDDLVNSVAAVDPGQVDYFTWLVIPLLIFLSRIVDVTIGTARVVFVSRGYKKLAAGSGFFEVLIWLIAMGQIMKNLTNPLCYLAYAGGFALGNYIGIRLTEKLSLGHVLVQVTTQRDNSSLVESLKQKQYGITRIEGTGARGAVAMIMTVVPRAELSTVVDMIYQFNPQAFYSVQEVGTVARGICPSAVSGNGAGMSLNRIFRPFRKGK